MKRSIFINILAASSLLLGVTSCEKALDVYSEPACRLNFYYSTLDNTSDFESGMNKGSYSFIYSGDAEKDTLWFEVESMGFLSDQDRPIALEQIETAHAAVAGRHYVAFDDPSLASLYVMPAGKARTQVPVVVLRDASLKSETVVLKFRIKPNLHFESGYEVLQDRELSLTDRLAEPSKWNQVYDFGYELTFKDFFGAYGPVKHKFLIDHSSFNWDDDFIESFMNSDNGYQNYLEQKMQALLDALNAERRAQGLEPLCEADGTQVVIYEPYHG